MAKIKSGDCRVTSQSKDHWEISGAGLPGVGLYGPCAGPAQEQDGGGPGERDFTPNYQPIPGKEEVIEELKDAADHSQKVYLATDPDREGEAISWHLKELLDLPDGKASRVTFNEITKKVVTESIAAPGRLTRTWWTPSRPGGFWTGLWVMNSPPAVEKIRRGLSAGRVQSVATRLVAEREEEIRAFVPQEYWTLEVTLTGWPPTRAASKPSFTAGRRRRSSSPRRTWTRCWPPSAPPLLGE